MMARVKLAHGIPFRDLVNRMGHDVPAILVDIARLEAGRFVVDRS